MHYSFVLFICLGGVASLSLVSSCLFSGLARPESTQVYGQDNVTTSQHDRAMRLATITVVPRCGLHDTVA